MTSRLRPNFFSLQPLGSYLGSVMHSRDPRALAFFRIPAQFPLASFWLTDFGRLGLPFFFSFMYFLNLFPSLVFGSQFFGLFFRPSFLSFSFLSSLQDSSMCYFFFGPWAVVNFEPQHNSTKAYTISTRSCDPSQLQKYAYMTSHKT